MIEDALTGNVQDFRATNRHYITSSLTYSVLKKKNGEFVSIYFDEESAIIYVFCKKLIYLYSNQQLVQKIDLYSDLELATLINYDYDYVYSYSNRHYLFAKKSGFIILQINENFEYSFNIKYSNAFNGKSNFVSSPYSVAILNNQCYLHERNNDIAKLSVDQQWETYKRNPRDKLINFHFIKEEGKSLSANHILICFFKNDYNNLYIEHSICESDFNPITKSKKIVWNDFNESLEKHFIKRINDNLIVLYMEGQLFTITARDTKLVWKSNKLRETIVINILAIQEDKKKDSVVFELFTNTGLKYRIRSNQLHESLRPIEIFRTKIRKTKFKSNILKVFPGKDHSITAFTTDYKLFHYNNKDKEGFVHEISTETFYKKPLFSDCVTYNCKGYLVSSLLITGSYSAKEGFIEKRYPSYTSNITSRAIHRSPESNMFVTNFWVTKNTIFYDSINYYFKGVEKHNKKRRKIINVLSNNRIIYDRSSIENNYQSQILFCTKVKYSNFNSYFFLKSSGEVEIWNYTSSKSKVTHKYYLEEANQYIMHSLSPFTYDGKLYLVVAYSTKLVIFENNVELYSIFLEPEKSIRSVEVVVLQTEGTREDITKIVVAYHDGTIRVYRGNLSELLVEINDFEKPFRVLSLNFRTNSVIAYNENDILLIDLINLSFETLKHNFRIRIMKINDVDSSLMLLDEDNSIHEILLKSNNNRDNYNSAVLSTNTNIPIKIYRTDIKDRFLILSEDVSTKYRKLLLLNSENMKILDTFDIGVDQSTNLIANISGITRKSHIIENIFCISMKINNKKKRGLLQDVLQILEIKSDKLVNSQTIHISGSISFLKFLINENLLLIVYWKETKTYFATFENKTNEKLNIILEKNVVESISLPEGYRIVDFFDNKITVINNFFEAFLIYLEFFRSPNDNISLKLVLHKLKYINSTDSIPYRGNKLRLDSSVNNLKYIKTADRDVCISKLAKSYWLQIKQIVISSSYPNRLAMCIVDYNEMSFFNQDLNFDDDIINLSILDKSNRAFDKDIVNIINGTVIPKLLYLLISRERIYLIYN